MPGHFDYFMVGLVGALTFALLDRVSNDLFTFFAKKKRERTYNPYARIWIHDDALIAKGEKVRIHIAKDRDYTEYTFFTVSPENALRLLEALQDNATELQKLVEQAEF